MTSAAAGGVERLVEIGDDVVRVLDADAEPDGLGPDAGLDLVGRRHLAMRRRGRMAGERLRVTEIDEPLDQLQRVVKPRAALIATLRAEGQQRAGAAAEIFLGKAAIGTVRKAGIVDPGDARIVAQEFGDL